MGPTLAQWRWRIGSETGASSMAIWHAMTGEDGLEKYMHCVPHDSSDFGRCARLLAQFDWEDRIEEMGDVSPMWQAMVAHWDDLTRMWSRGDHGGVNRRLRDIHDELQRLPQNEDWLAGESVLFPNELKDRLDTLLDPEDVDPDALLPDDAAERRYELMQLIDTLKAHPDLREELVSALYDEEG